MAKCWIEKLIGFMTSLTMVDWINQNYLASHNMLMQSQTMLLLVLLYELSQYLSAYLNRLSEIIIKGKMSGRDKLAALSFWKTGRM